MACPSRIDTPYGVLKVVKLPNVSCVTGQGFEDRAASTARLLKDATRDLPYFPPLTINVGDGFWSCNETDLTYATKQRSCQAQVIPDFIFGGWPSTGVSGYSLLISRLHAASRTRAARNACGWATSLNCPLRQRAAAILARSPDVFELHVVNCAKALMRERKRHATANGSIARPWMPTPNYAQLTPNASNASCLDMEEQARRTSCLLDVQGLGFSARVPLLLHAGRTLLYVERDVVSFVSDGAPSVGVPPIQPWVHYVPVRLLPREP